MPKVEILLATYNGERYLAEQLDSIVNQTWTDWHITISDDASTDQTLDVINQYVEKYPDKITWLKHNNRFGNARDHFFYLMQQCQEDYMFFCDQDDKWSPEKISKTMKRMLRAESEYGIHTPLLVFTDQTPTDAQLKPIATSLMRYQKQFFQYFDYRSILMQNVVTGGAMCINRSLAQLAGRCLDHTKTIMHDWWIAVVASRYGQIIYIDEPLSDYRQHGKNSVGAKDVRSVGHVIHKVSHLNEIRRTISEKKVQASLFLDTYSETLDTNDAYFLKTFARPRSGVMFYFRNRKLIHGFFRLAGMMLLG